MCAQQARRFAVFIRFKRSYYSIRKESGWCGEGWQFSYESRLYQAGELVHVILPCGLVAAFTQKGEAEKKDYRDIVGNGRFTLLYQQIDKLWEILDSHSHSIYQYDEEGKLIAVQDKNKQKTEFIYENQQLKEMVSPLKYHIYFTFKQGRLVELKDQMGRKVSYSYEGELLSRVIHADGGVSTYQYDEKGYLIRLLHGRDNSALTNIYDEAGRALCQKTAAGDTYEATYQEGKRRVLVKSSKYSGIRQYHYDEHKAITKVCYPDGSTEEYEYDAYHNQSLIQNRRGGKLQREYDDNGRLVREETPEGLITTYTYDERGDMVLLKDNAGRRKKLSYDSYHNLIQVTENIGKGEEATCHYAYDEKGRLLSQIDGEGNRTTYTYEENGAYPTNTTYADGSMLTCEYDALGRKLSEKDGAVAFSYGYNQGGYRTVVRDGEGNGHHYFYDAQGRLISHYSPRQWKKKEKHTAYRYDVWNRLIQVIHPDGSVQKIVRDSEGNILKRIHPKAYNPKTGDGE